VEAQSLHMNVWRGARIKLAGQLGGSVGSALAESDKRLHELAHQLATICIMEQTRCSGAAVGAGATERLSAADAAAHDLTGMEARHWLHEGEAWKLPRVPVPVTAQDEVSVLLRSLLRHEERMRSALHAHAATLGVGGAGGSGEGDADSVGTTPALLQVRDPSTADCLELLGDALGQAFQWVHALPFASLPAPPGEAQRSVHHGAHLLACALAVATTADLPVDAPPASIPLSAAIAHALSRAGLAGGAVWLQQPQVRAQQAGSSLTWEVPPRPTTCACACTRRARWTSSSGRPSRWRWGTAPTWPFTAWP
jgi:hypothetical protein